MDTAEQILPDWARPGHPPAPFAQLLAASVRDHAAATAIVAPGRPDLTYADLDRVLKSIAVQLAGAGFGHGTRIGVALPNGPDLAVAIVAICSAATCAPFNDALDEEALLRLLVAMRIDALIVPAEKTSAATLAARRAGIALIALRGSAREPVLARELVPVSRRGRVAVEPPLADDIALLMHTSGTTGAAKIVPWEQWRVAETVRNRIELSRIDRFDRCLVAYPLYSSAAIRRVLAGLLTGGAVICPGAQSADATVDLLESLAPTQYFAPPASHIALLEAFERRVPRPRHSLKGIWAATTDMPDAVRSRMERAFSVPVINGYGMTESGSITQTPFPPERAPAGSVGRATNMEIGIVDDAGRFLAAGEVGEIVVRGPEVFAGYENNDEANRSAFRDGWFRTGDTGRIDVDGFLYLSGRLTDVVNRGGEKIAPVEVEAALARHPKVIDAAVFAVPHPTWGQNLAAAVVLRDPVSERELRRFLRDELAAFKIPTRIVEVTELPRGLGGKVSRTELARLVAGTTQRRTESPPIGGEEAEIARIFCDVLAVQGVSRLDNFFELGGDSLSAMRMLAAVRATFGIAVKLDALLHHPTVSELAAAISDGAR